MGLAKLQGRRWERFLDRVASWRYTTVFRVRGARQNTDRQNDDLDAIDPSDTFSRIEASPFLSHFGGGTAGADGGEQQGRDQCYAKDVEEGHPGRTGNQEKKDRD